MRAQAEVTVLWAETSKRWVVEITAKTTDGIYARSTTCEDEYGCPMTPETAMTILEYVRMALERQYPW